MKFNLKEKKENIKEEIDEKKENEKSSIPKSVPIQKETKKYGETICKIAGKNTLLEFTTNGFNLAPKDKEGNRKELSCHISMNFVEYDDNFRQTKYIPFYLNSVTWRGLKMDFQSGFFDKLADKEIKKGNQFASPIYSFNGGTPKGPNGKPLCRILNISPAKREGNFLLTAIQAEGEVQKNGTITFKKGSKQSRISISVSHTTLGGILDEVASFIPKNI